jgi:hypothetical protein
MTRVAGTRSPAFSTAAANIAPSDITGSGGSVRPRETKRVVFIVIDGARPDVFTALLERGDLPNIARRVLEPGSFRVGTTVFPSTTGVAYVPFLLGRFPGGAGVPGIRWLDRAITGGDWRAQWRGARSYCGVQAPWLNGDLDSTPTLFECVPQSIAICSPITRGLAPGTHLIPVQRALYALAAHYVGTYASFDNAVIRAWHAAAKRDWRFLFVVLPGIDGNTHFFDPYHESVLAGYRAVDRALGVFIQRCWQYAKAPPPDFFMVSDHGAEPVREHCDIALAMEARGYPTIRHPFHVWRAGARAAVMVSGNSAAHVYLEPRSGRVEPRTLDEVPEELLDFLTELNGVGLIACRDGAGGVHVLAREGRAHIVEHAGVITCTSVSGDPLGLGGTRVALEDREMLARTLPGELPDAPRQLLNLMSSARAGDIVLSAGRGFDFRGPWEVPEHKSGHGGLLAEHMRVPIASSIPLPDSPMRTVDLMPTILEHLGLAVPAGIDGVAAMRLEHARSIA